VLVVQRFLTFCDCTIIVDIVTVSCRALEICYQNCVYNAMGFIEEIWISSTLLAAASPWVLYPENLGNALHDVSKADLAVSA